MKTIDMLDMFDMLDMSIVPLILESGLYEMDPALELGLLGLWEFLSSS